MSDQITIVGAGFAGLLAAIAFPGSRVVEAGPRRLNHSALLRFRSPAVAHLTGIPFREVRVLKSIYADGRHFDAPTIAHRNAYSMKVLDGLIDAERSIGDLRPVTRYIAPPDFHERLVEIAEERSSPLHFNRPFDFDPGFGAPVINTAPLPHAISALYPSEGHPVRFDYASIRVLRLELGDRVQAHQTVYFPNPVHGLYRASITDSTLILEFARDPSINMGLWQSHVLEAFTGSRHDDNLIADALVTVDEETVDEVAVPQRFGKIRPIPGDLRRSILGRLTREHNIYSLGRFATWRNVLLDDVVDDLDVIRRLMASDGYQQRLFAAR